MSMMRRFSPPTCIAVILDDQLLLGSINNVVSLKPEMWSKIAILSVVCEFELDVLKQHPTTRRHFRHAALTAVGTGDQYRSSSPSSSSTTGEEDDVSASSAAAVPRLHISIDDCVESDIGVHFEQCADWIDNMIVKRGKIVCVHCAAGRSRSASIVIAYLIMKRGMSLRDAIELVVKRRPIAAPNEGFMYQLHELEKFLVETKRTDKNEAESTSIQAAAGARGTDGKNLRPFASATSSPDQAAATSVPSTIARCKPSFQNAKAALQFVGWVSDAAEFSSETTGTACRNKLLESAAKYTIIDADGEQEKKEGEMRDDDEDGLLLGEDDGGMPSRNDMRLGYIGNGREQNQQRQASDNVMWMPTPARVDVEAYFSLSVDHHLRHQPVLQAAVFAASTVPAAPSTCAAGAAASSREEAMLTAYRRSVAAAESSLAQDQLARDEDNDWEKNLGDLDDLVDNRTVNESMTQRISSTL